MRILSPIAVISATFVCLLATPSAAQFGQSSGTIGSGTGSSGQSNFGASTANRTGGVQNQTIGTLRNGSRFERGARRGGEFVGSDARDQQAFVGAVQGATNSAGISSVAGVRASSGPNAASVNQVRQRSAATAVYDPTLVVAFDVPHVTPECAEQEINFRLTQLSGFEGGQVSVQLVGQTALIRGSVATTGQRRCVELYLQMEPGIASVDNRLQVIGAQESESSRFEQVPTGRPLTELFSAPSGN